jgi:glycosyltransferase involved in cell wall biosynthesis
MKVLHVCETIIGGTGSYLSEILSDQAKIYGSANIALLIPDSHMEFIEQNILDSNIRIETFRRPSRRLGLIFLIWSYFRCLRMFSPDIVHAHSSFAGLVTRLPGLRGRARVVFCPHGWAFDIVGTFWIKYLAKIVEKLLAHKADKIIVISHYEYQRAISIGIEPSRLRLVLNGISSKVPEIEPAEWQDHRLKVLFVGRLDHQKGLDILLSAVEPLEATVALRIIGDAAVDKTRSDVPKFETLQYLGWLSREDVAAQMKACDVLVVPSRWEGFGLVAIEAMRLSVPVLASAVGGLVEILGEGEFGFLVPPEDAEALRASIAGLSSEKLKAKGAAGRRRFMSHFSSDRMLREIDETYRLALGKSKRSAVEETVIQPARRNVDI